MNAKKKTAGAKAPTEEMSFEHAIERLESIVADMEAADLPLDEVLKRYEEGTQLVRFCGRKLEEAEKKIELLTQQADGSVALKPFREATAEHETEDEEKEADDRLF